MDQTYQVYCSQQAADNLRESGYINQVEYSFLVKVDYMDGCFFVHRNLADTYSHQQAKHTLISMLSSATIQENPAYQWYWMGKVGWVPYEHEANQQIEAAYQGKTSLILELNERLYNVDPTEFTQYTFSGQYRRPIMRQPPPPPEQKAFRPQKTVTWVYYVKNEEHELSDQYSINLERAYQRGKKSYYIKLNDEIYDVVFQTMTMIKRSSPETFKVGRKTEQMGKQGISKE